MITLYSKDFKTKYGSINSGIEFLVEEERNGLFELSFIMLNTDSLFNYVKEDNIVVVNANDTLLNQKFRIYMTRKLMNNRVEVYARHISFDLMYDYIDNVSFENQSCEYALNQLFRNSNFSKHYKGYSDIVNAQNYSMSMANVLEAIGGKQGSIIDTFGTGAEILRDNENIHILNKRGHDNDVTIEYKKNLTGFELQEDTTDLITRILPYAKYNDEAKEEIILKADYVDSPLINNYSHPYIASIDYSDKFKDGEIPTISKLQELARKEYKDNKVDIPKQNFKIEFIPLSKCVGYEGLEDKISLCDTVTIIDTRYNVKTQAKVIRTVFNVLKNRYESMELGDPKTTLGDVIGNGSSEGTVGPPGPPGPPGADGSVEDFPDTLPFTPTVTTTVYGFANIEISWTFENKIYYQYEVYASKEANFTPNTFNLIHQGQTSTFMCQAKPNETWYFKVCAINSYGNRTSFGSASATTSKVSDLSNYVSNMAIDDALIGTLSLDRGWIGTLRGNYIDAKQLSVTDGNGKRTLDIDSFGNVNLNVTSLTIKSKDVLTSGSAITDINVTPGTVKINADKIKLDGTTTVGGEGRHIRIKENDICFYEKATEYPQDLKLEIGFQENEMSKGTYVPKIRMGCYGMNPDAGSINEGNYVLIHHMPQGANPHDSNTDAFAITHRNKLTKNWNGYRSFGNGRVSLTSLDNTVDLKAKDGIRLQSNTYFDYLSGARIYAENISVGSLIYSDTVNCRALGAGGTILMHSSLDGNNKNLGWSESRFNQVCAKAIWGDTGSWSDIRTKENIRYLDDEILLVNDNNNVSKSELFDFIKSLRLCEYNYKEEFKSCQNDKIGFIANSVTGDKIGDKIVAEHEGYLTYNLNNMLFTTIGALQEEVRIREEENKKLKDRLDNIEEILKKIKPIA